MTIGVETYPVPAPFLVLATQNPIESEGTYPLPEAQVDRFLMKILVDYPTPGDEAAVVDRSLVAAPELEQRLDAAQLLDFRERGQRDLRRPRDDRLRRRARGRHPAPGPLRPDELEPLVSYGASPRGPIGLVQAARALALLRGRRHVLAGRHHRPRARRAAPPPRAQLRGPQRGRDAGHDPRQGARRRRRARATTAAHGTARRVTEAGTSERGRGPLRLLRRRRDAAGDPRRAGHAARPPGPGRRAERAGRRARPRASCAAPAA